jgi:molybdenum cofactor biosynthesis enzyme MoaA
MENEITVEITNYCPNECSYCSSNAGLNGKPLDYETIEKFLISNLPEGTEDELHRYDRINISGGEPLSHPDLWKILVLANKLAKTVHINTNAIEYLDVNCSIVKHIKVTANLCTAPNTIVNIPLIEGELHILDFIPQGRGKNIIPIKTVCSSNISNPENCKTCHNLVLKADGTIAKSPCKKDVFT